MMMYHARGRHFRFFGVWVMGIAVALISLATLPDQTQAAGVPQSFTPGNLIDDGSFVAIDSMSVADIQRFLDSKGGRLATFIENDRSAAEIIWGAAHGHGHASGECTGDGDGPTICNGIDVNTTTGTVNPRVILATLQKEQSLITNPNPSQNALDCAMGYENGQGCQWMFENRPQYRGFTNQVENAAWQLRYNFIRATDNRFNDYKVGQTMTFYDPSGMPHQVTLSNAATASLWRYTPVYSEVSGNYNFWNLYRQWFVRWAAELVNRNWRQAAPPGDTVELIAQFKNIGEETWQRSTVRLATDRARDRVSSFLRENRTFPTTRTGWVTDNRVELLDAPVAPGQVGTFLFYYTVPQWAYPGRSSEYFNLVADGVEWFPSLDLSWEIDVLPLDERFRANWVSQNPYPTLAPGDSYHYEVAMRNTGSSTWQRGAVTLGTDRARDRNPGFTRGAGWTAHNRIALVEESVAPGATGTFRFTLTVPTGTSPGVYREYFRPVADGIAWLDDWGVYWDVTVLSLAEAYRANWVSQNAYPTLAVGDSYQFEVLIRNTGSGTWQKGVVNLGTDRDRDRIPAFTRGAGWVSNNRVELVETTVSPNDIGTFRFTLTVPTGTSPGVYREYFRPVADGIAWLDDWGVYWDVTVN